MRLMEAVVALNGVHEFLPGCSRTRSPWRDVLEHAIWTLGLALVLAVAIWIIVGFRVGGTLLGPLVVGFYVLLMAAAEVVAQDILGVRDFAGLFPNVPEGVVMFAALPMFLTLWLTLPVAVIVPLLCRIVPNPRAAEPRPWCGLSAHLLAAICSAAVAWYLFWSWFGKYQLITGGVPSSQEEMREQAIEGAWYGVGTSALPIAILPLALMILRRAIGATWRRLKGHRVTGGVAPSHDELQERPPVRRN
jgi:hypothetical protein